MPGRGLFAFYANNPIKGLPEDPKVENLEDHCYAASPTLADHQYASQGPLWLKECDALQDELVGGIPLVSYGISSWMKDHKYDCASVFIIGVTHYFNFR